jgi:ketosteroid isomerase-like protein
VADLRADREELFGFLASPDTRPRFWERVADDVDWTVEGTHPLAGRYGGKEIFVAATFERLAAVFAEGAKLEVVNLVVDGETTVAELRVTATTAEGAAYDNMLCWVCRFAGEQIVEVRAYLDSAMVTWTLLRNEGRRSA